MDDVPVAMDLETNEKGILERCFSPDELSFLMLNDQFSTHFDQAKSEAYFDNLCVTGIALLRRWSPGWSARPEAQRKAKATTILDPGLKR